MKGETPGASAVQSGEPGEATKIFSAVDTLQQHERAQYTTWMIFTEAFCFF